MNLISWWFKKSVKPDLTITDIKVNKEMACSGKNTCLVGIATVKINGILTISHIRIIRKGDGHLTVSMPSRDGAQGESAYFTTTQARKALKEAILSHV